MTVLMLVAEHLCVHDPRALAFVQGDEVPPRGACACDRCWSGRDLLAVTLQEAADLLEVCDDQLRSQPMGNEATSRALFALLARLKRWRADYEPAGGLMS